MLFKQQRCNSSKSQLIFKHLFKHQKLSVVRLNNKKECLM
nr:MAG TPA: hypothetical protein [Caudoviricetes sp.]